MWRPESWDNPYGNLDTDIFGSPSIGEKIKFEAYEAGADAMLGALREQGVKAKTSAEDKLVMAIDQIMMNLGQNEKGKVVFIPDEEADDESLRIN
jgi:hypothetical protein